MIQKVLKNIEIICENLEIFVIEKYDILQLDIINILTNYNFIPENVLSVFKMTDNLTLKIKNIECRKVRSDTMVKDNEDDRIGDRLKKWRDIACIILNYEGGEKEQINIAWEDYDADDNAYQTTEIQDNTVIIKVNTALG